MVPAPPRPAVSSLPSLALLGGFPPGLSCSSPRFMGLFDSTAAGNPAQGKLYPVYFAAGAAIHSSLGLLFRLSLGVSKEEFSPRILSQNGIGCILAPHGAPWETRASHPGPAHTQGCTTLHQRATWGERKALLLFHTSEDDSITFLPIQYPACIAWVHGRRFLIGIFNEVPWVRELSHLSR